jgi:hypothetical protein
MVHAKFNLNFLDLPTSSSQILRFETISGIYLNKQEKSLNSAWAESGPWPRSFGHSGRWSGGTQSACFPGPRPKRLGLRGPAQGRSGAAWLAHTLAGVARIRCAIAAHAARMVVRLTTARRWMESGKVLC